MLCGEICSLEAVTLTIPFSGFFGQASEANLSLLDHIQFQKKNPVFIVDAKTSSDSHWFAWSLVNFFSYIVLSKDARNTQFYWYCHHTENSGTKDSYGLKQQHLLIQPRLLLWSRTVLFPKRKATHTINSLEKAWDVSELCCSWVV